MNPEQAVLLVDDDKLDALFFARAYRISTCSNPLHIVHSEEEGQMYLRGDGEYGDRVKYPFPCLVIVDVTLPDKNGLELVKWMRSRSETKSVGVEVLGGTGKPGEREEAEGYGINGFHIKPQSLEGLNALVVQMLGAWCPKDKRPSGNGEGAGSQSRETGKNHI